ncbi:DUF4198 domain-containing protein [Vibrio campbellii]|uniref:DUF4198 domain-containing protein n=1 Tax=Vibrio campbellii TaxID=680 RepID=UPI001F073264|nr:DUF4198 domain-containing protein [Vibrio campbellii]UMM02517.1 DUF4198 domain-containing protein [Vibrio campbellii]
MAKRTLLILALALFSVGASAMFWPFKKYDVEMSPEVRGVIKLDGVPQAGLTVYRELYYEGYKKGKTLTDKARTNEYGEFSFDPVTVRSSAPGDIFGGSLRVYQNICVNCDSEKKEIWGAWVPTEGAESLSWMLMNIDCELSNSKRIHEVETSSESSRRTPVHSVCDWDNQKIDTYEYDEVTDTHVLKSNTKEG